MTVSILLFPHPIDQSSVLKCSTLQLYFVTDTRRVAHEGQHTAAIQWLHSGRNLNAHKLPRRTKAVRSFCSTRTQKAPEKTTR